jgi:hypothetical protein
LRRFEAGVGAEPVLREGLAENCCVLQQPALIGREAVETGGDQRVEGLGHLERLDRTGQAIDGALLNEQAPVEQHSHRLHGVERDALCASEDPVAQLAG